MSDPRTTPANERVAASALRGQVDAPAFVDGTEMHCLAPVLDLFATPQDEGRARSRTSQLLFGDRFVVYETIGAFSFGQCEKDAYCGYVHSARLGRQPAPTHSVASRMSHRYAAPDMKSQMVGPLYLNSLLHVTKVESAWARLADGSYMPSSHTHALSETVSDYVAVAQLLCDAPYLWGGSSSDGVDCSGLVQLALHACGQACPRDSDQQETELGTSLPEDAPLERGDLVFWKGHVAIATDRETILHANAHHMAVRHEPLEGATQRILAAGDGAVTSRKRLEFSR